MDKGANFNFQKAGRSQDCSQVTIIHLKILFVMMLYKSALKLTLYFYSFLDIVVRFRAKSGPEDGFVRDFSMQSDQLLWAVRCYGWVACFVCLYIYILFSRYFHHHHLSLHHFHHCSHHHHNIWHLTLAFRSVWFDW